MKLQTLNSAACLLAIGAFAGSANAATFTWNGSAGGNWYDTGNWDGSSAPTDGTLIRTTSSADVVIFDSETASSMPGTIGTYQSWTGSRKMPSVEVRNGSVTFSGGQNWGWSGIDTFVVGDGDLGTAAEVNVSFSNLNRDPNGLKTYVVNADGTFNVSGSLSKWADNASSGGKKVVVELNGGAMVVNGTINANLTNGSDYNYVTFDAAGSTFTANFGGQLVDLAAVQNEIDISGAFKDSTGNGLLVTNNGSSFTVSVAPEPSSLALIGLGALLVSRRRRS